MQLLGLVELKMLQKILFLFLNWEVGELIHFAVDKITHYYLLHLMMMKQMFCLGVIIIMVKLTDIQLKNRFLDPKSFHFLLVEKLSLSMHHDQCQ